MFYIFHGEDEFGQAEELLSLRQKLAAGDPAMAELNTNLLDGNRLTLDELVHVCNSIPFLSDRRLVIVYNLLSRLSQGSKGIGSEEAGQRHRFLEGLAAYLPTLPPTTRLVFVENKTLASSHPILRLARAKEKERQAFVKLFAKPKDSELPRWIEERVRSQNGSISREAASLLAVLIGDDLRLLEQEIEKLLLYADGKQIRPEDVQTLVSRARETKVFDLVDCVGQRQTGKALLLLHRLLEEGEDPLSLLAMLARQIRILIQVKELQTKGLTAPQITERLGLHPYVVEKSLAQARNFTMAQLEAAHQHLVDTDWALKTGITGERLALELLVINLTAG